MNKRRLITLWITGIAISIFAVVVVIDWEYTKYPFYLFITASLPVLIIAALLYYTLGKVEQTFSCESASRNQKNHMWRFFKMNRTLTDVLLNVRINNAGTEYVFCNQRGEPYLGNRGGSVRTAFRGALRRARIEKFRLP